MRGTGTAERAGSGSVVRVWRAEGFSAVRDRVWDRIREASIRARCVQGGRDPWPDASILNVIGVPMTTVFGGVPLQLRARLRHESMVRPVALLSREPGGSAAPGEPGGPGAGGLGRGAGGWRLESWSDGRPRRAVTFPAGDWDGDPLHDDPAWRHAVHTSVGLVNARAIHVENAAGLSLVSLSAIMGIDTAMAATDAAAADAADGPRVRVVLSVHDLSLFSRQPHGAPASADRPAHAGGRARAAASPSGAAFSDVDVTQEASPDRSRDRYVADRAASREALIDDRQRFEHAFHHALGTGILRAAAFTIYPSQFMRHRIEALPHLPAHVVAPGIEPPPARARAPRSARRDEQIAILGGGQEHKGGPRLARIAAALAARGLRVTSYGGYGHEYLLQMRGIRGVRVRGYYRAGSLPELLARQGASVALILSAVPESFSLVLSEAWAAGVPVIAPATGAFVERLQAGGLLISGDASDEEVVAAIERARGMSWDALPTPPTAAQAAERHVALYRDAGFIVAPADS